MAEQVAPDTPAPVALDTPAPVVLDTQALGVLDTPVGVAWREVALQAGRAAAAQVLPEEVRRAAVDRTRAAPAAESRARAVGSEKAA